MTDPFVGEIRMFAGTFAPNGWALCEGQLVPISQNTALFSLLGTSYGGDGKSTFALPDLRDASPVHHGQGPGRSQYDLGQSGGSQSVTLVPSELPSHSHAVMAVDAGTLGTTGNPSAGTWATARQGRVTEKLYSSSPATQTMSPTALAVTGGGQPHNNMAPYLAITFIIALQGVFPQRP